MISLAFLSLNLLTPSLSSPLLFSSVFFFFPLSLFLSLSLTHFLPFIANGACGLWSLGLSLCVMCECVFSGASVHRTWEAGLWTHPFLSQGALFLAEAGKGWGVVTCMCYHLIASFAQDNADTRWVTGYNKRNHKTLRWSFLYFTEWYTSRCNIQKTKKVSDFSVTQTHILWLIITHSQHSSNISH